MQDYMRMLRLFNRDARLFLVTTALFGFTIFGGIYPVLLNLYLLRLNYGPEFIGLLNSSGSLAVAIFCLPAGSLGGRFGSRQVMIAGSILMALGNGLLPLTEAAPHDWQSGWLLGMNILACLGLALYVTNIGPFLMGVSGAEERNHIFSVQGALGPLAAFAGSLCGGFLPALFGLLLKVPLDRPDPYRYPLILAAVALIPSVFLLLATRNTTATRVIPGADAAAAGRAPIALITMLTVVIMFQVASEGVARTYFNVYLDAGLHIPTDQIGLLAALGQLLAAPAALLTPMLMNRWGGRRTYMVAALGMVLSLLPLVLIPHWIAAGAGFVGIMMVAATARTAISVYGMVIVTPGWRALTAGATSMAVGLSWAVMSLIGGYAIESLGYRNVFAIGALITLAGALVFGFYFRVPRGEEARSALAGSP